MSTISKSALVPYSAAEMFALVDDIDRYAEFLPWCRSTTEHERGADEVRASIEVAKGPVQKSFTTLNRMQANKMIEMRLVEGPFKHLEGFWRFDALNDTASKVSLDMAFEFSNKAMTLAFGSVFNQIANSLVDAFCKRAEQVYGKR